MSIYKGNGNNPSAIYVGNSSIGKVYLGMDLVWQKYVLKAIAANINTSTAIFGELWASGKLNGLIETYSDILATLISKGIVNVQIMGESEIVGTLVSYGRLFLAIGTNTNISGAMKANGKLSATIGCSSQIVSDCVTTPMSLVVADDVEYIGTSTDDDPVTMLMSGSSGVSLLVLSIQIPSSGSPRSGVAPTYDGTSMTQVGSHAGTDFTEIWYMIDPPASGTISIPNTGPCYLSCHARLYTGGENIALYGNNYATGTCTSEEKAKVTLTVPANTSVLLINSVVLRWASSVLSSPNSSDYTEYVGTMGSGAGFAHIRKICQSYFTSYEMWWSFVHTPDDIHHDWQSLGAVFTTI